MVYDKKKIYDYKYDDFADLIQSIKEQAQDKKTEHQYPSADTIDRRKDEDYIETLKSYERLTLLVLAELVAQGKADFLFIEQPEVADFWHKHCYALGQLRGRADEERRISEIKQSALNKLTDEEKKVLGIK